MSTTRRRRQRRTLFGFGLTAGVLLTGSAAFACTTFLGEMLVTGSNSGTSFAVGSKSSMTYCDPNDVTAGATSDSNDSITVAVAPASECTGGATNKLPNGTYDVNFINNTAYDFMFGGWNLDQSNGNCMSLLGSSGTRTFAGSGADNDKIVITGGTGADSESVDFDNLGGTGSITSDTTNIASGICVSDANGGNGMEVPIKMI